MYFDNIQCIPGTVVSGKLMQGVLKKGEAVEIAGYGTVLKTTASGLPIYF